MNNNRYNRHDIKKGWNHPLATKVRELDLEPVSKEVLQAICMFGKIYLYKTGNAGLPNSLVPHLGYQVTKEQVVEGLKTLEQLKFVTRLGGQKLEKGKIEILYSVNKHQIDEALQPSLPDTFDQLF